MAFRLASPSLPLCQPLLSLAESLTPTSQSPTCCQSCHPWKPPPPGPEGARRVHRWAWPGQLTLPVQWWFQSVFVAESFWSVSPRSACPLSRRAHLHKRWFLQALSWRVLEVWHVVPGLAWQPVQSLDFVVPTTRLLGPRWKWHSTWLDHSVPWQPLCGLEPTWSVYLGEGMACVASASGATCCWRLWPAEAQRPGFLWVSGRSRKQLASPKRLWDWRTFNPPQRQPLSSGASSAED